MCRLAMIAWTVALSTALKTVTNTNRSEYTISIAAPMLYSLHWVGLGRLVQTFSADISDDKLGKRHYQVSLNGRSSN